MSTRSITPVTSCSEPIGISVATTCWPKADFSESSVRKKSARSRSSMLTNTRRARSSSAARCHSRVVWTSTPITALTTNTADSHTRSAPSASAMKLESPGVSIRLTLRSCHSNEESAAEIDIWRAFSSGSVSDTVVPSTTVPEPVDRAGLEQQRLVQRGLTTAAVADERHVADAIRGLVHAFLLSLERRRSDLTAWGSRRRQNRCPWRASSRARRRASSAAAAPPWCAAGRRVTRSRRGPRRSRAGSGSRSSRGRRRASRARAGRRSRRRSGRAARSGRRAACGSGAPRSGSVSSSETWSPVESETFHSSSSATIVEFEICSSASWNSSSVTAELARHLLVGRRALEPRLELHVDPLDLARPRAHRARHPVERAQLVDDRAADAGDRVGLELDLPREIEALDRGDQPAEPVGDQVGLLDVGGQPRAHPPGDVLDQRRVGDHQPLARTLVARRPCSAATGPAARSL